MRPIRLPEVAPTMRADGWWSRTSATAPRCVRSPAAAASRVPHGVHGARWPADGNAPGSVRSGCCVLLMEEKKMSAAEIPKLLYRESGLKGLSGLQQRHARAGGKLRSRRRLSHSSILSIASGYGRGRSLRRSGVSMHSSSQPELARTHRACGPGLRRSLPGSGCDLDVGSQQDERDPDIDCQQPGRQSMSCRLMKN